MIVIVLLFQNPQNQKITDGPIASKVKQLNIPSLLVLTVSIMCLLLALEWGGTTYSWSSGRVIALLVVAGVAFTAFVCTEILLKDRATIPRSVLANRTVGLCVLYAFCASAALSVTDYFVSCSKPCHDRKTVNKVWLLTRTSESCPYGFKQSKILQQPNLDKCSSHLSSPWPLLRSARASLFLSLVTTHLTCYSGQQ